MKRFSVSVDGIATPILTSEASVVMVITPVSKIGGSSSTVTEQVAVNLPSSVVAVIVAVPEATAVTSPAELTVATLLSSELHVTALLASSSGSGTKNL